MKRSPREKLQYKIDNIMSKGTVSLVNILFWLTLLVAVVVGALVTIFGTETGIGHQTWNAIMHALDPGVLSGAPEDSSIAYLIGMSVLTLYGVLVMSILIGIISAGIEEKLNQLRKGFSKIIEENHVVILGFNDNIYTLLSELIEANSNHEDGCIVVVGTEEKEDMEKMIHDKFPDTRTTRIICRSGSLSDQHLYEQCSMETSKCVIINEYDDASVIKIILSAGNYMKNHELLHEELYMVAVIHDEENVDAAMIAGEGRAEIIYASRAISRIIAHSCRCAGIYQVLVELFDYDGDELYYESVPELAGCTFGESLNRFSKEIVFGIWHGDKSYLNPPMDMVIEKGDKLILLEEDDGAFRVNEPAELVKKEQIVEHDTKMKREQEKILMLGINEKMESILEEYDKFVIKGSEIIIVCIEDLPFVLDQFENLQITHIQEKETNRKVLEQVVTDNIKKILILNDDTENAEKSDADTLLQLLFLKDIAIRKNLDFSITSELMKSGNQRLASQIREEDFIIGSNIINLIMTQVSENRELANVFAELLQEEGSEIYFRPAEDYVKLGEPVNFYTVSASAALKSEVAVGYRKENGSGFDVITNPKKEEEVIFGVGDYIIVLAED